MTISSSGPIKFSDLQAEFGGTNPISLSEYYRGGTYVKTYDDNISSVSTAGSIDLGEFKGAAKHIPTLTIQSFTSVYPTTSWTVPASFTGTLDCLLYTSPSPRD